MAQIQIPSEIADWIAAGVRESQSDLEIARQQSLTQLTQRRRAVQAKLDRGCTFNRGTLVVFITITDLKPGRRDFLRITVRAIAIVRHDRDRFADQLLDPARFHAGQSTADT